MRLVPNPLAELRRPRLLVSAARAGTQDYDRRRVLGRLTGGLPTPAEAVSKLLELEEAADDRRRSGAAGYSIARHVELLIALIAEARLAANA